MIKNTFASDHIILWVLNVKSEQRDIMGSIDVHVLNTLLIILYEASMGYVTMVLKEMGNAFVKIRNMIHSNFVKLKSAQITTKMRK